MVINKPRLLIIGGGFAGVWAALAAAKQIEDAGVEIEIVLLSKDANISMRPRLYQKNPLALYAPLAPTIDPVGVKFIHATASAIDPVNKTLTYETSDGKTDNLNYDRLVVALGSETYTPPVPGLAACAWTINTHNEAFALDAHLQKLSSRPSNKSSARFIIIGSGMCGIEMATEMRARITQHAGAEYAAQTRIVLLERNDKIAPSLGDGTRFANKTIILTAGLRANALCATLAETPGVTVDALGRLNVDATLRVQGLSDVFAAGDAAHAFTDDTHVALMSCQHAAPTGRRADTLARATLDT